MSTSPARRAAGWRRLMAAAIAALCLGLPMAAQAQSYEIQSLNDRLSMMQRDLQALQRQVYSGGGSVGATGDGTNLGSSSAVANQEIRLQQLDDQMRSLTGEVEQLSYKLQQVSTRLDKLVGDVDFRLRALEQGQGGAGGPPPGQDMSQQTTPPPAAGNGMDAQQETVISGAGSQSGQQQGLSMSPPPQTLGTLTQQQLNQNRVTLPTEPQAAPAAVGAGAPAEEQYNNALELLRQANYPQAEQAFRGFVRAHPSDKLAGNAQYWLGETYYVRGNYTDAAVAFAEGYQKYPNNAKAPDNLLKLGMSLAALNRKGDACKAYQQLARQYPNAPQTVKTRASRERQAAGCAG
ncbi:MAG: tol-pal system protein YbgF [Dongiaceae bacterium]